MSHLTVSPDERAYCLGRPTLQDANVKNDNSRTYDFCHAKKRAGRPRAQRQVSDLLVDGWSAYYRWLDELKRRLPVRASPRQSD